MNGIDLTCINSLELLFSQMDVGGFTRAISNLINNSVEAIRRTKRQDAEINVSLQASGDNIDVSIADEGCGMSAERLLQIQNAKHVMGEKGVGLKQVSDFLADVGGKFFIDSSVGYGSRVMMRIPRCDAPEVFACVISLAGARRVVVIDDDATSAILWRGRLAHKQSFRECLVEVIHLSSVEDVQKFMRQDCQTSDYFFVDYELNDRMDGVQIISTFALQGRATLVTSWFQGTKVIKRCKKEGIKILPKSAIRMVRLNN